MSFARHIERLRRRQARRPVLEESLIGGRTGRYALYRLRIVAAARGLALAVHLVELVFLTRAFSSGSLVLALVLQNGAALVGGFWWGALEELRQPLRQMRPDAVAAQLIERWLRRSRLVAAACAAIATAALIASGPAPLIAAYAAVVIGRLVVDLILRTYYSGVYARRRVYRPMSVILAVEAAGLAVVLILWPVIGPWSFPLGFAAGVAASRAALLIYTRRAYRQLRQVEPHRGDAAPPASRAIAAAGMAGVAGRAGSLVVMGLLFAGPGDIAIVAHAVAPLLTTAAGWPFVFYLDVAKLAATGARRLGARLERALLWIGTAVAAVLVLATVAVLAAMFGPGALGAAAALAPVLVAQSLLAALQLARFARRDYRPVALGSLGLAAGLGAGLAAMAWAPWPPGVTTSAGAGLALVLSVAVTAAVGRAPRPVATSGVLDSGLAWLEALQTIEGPVTTGELTLAERRAATRNRALEVVAAHLGERGAVYACAPDRLRWFAAGDAGSPIDRKRASRPGKAGPVGRALGRVDRKRASRPGKAGPVGRALAPLGRVDPRALQLELAGLVDHFAAAVCHAGADEAAAALMGGPDTALAELIAAARSFDGAVVAELGGATEQLAALAPGDRQEIWRQAMAAASGARRRRGAYDVSVFCPGGVIEVIFALPRSAPGERRSAFRRRAEAASAAATIYSKSRTTP